MSDAVQAAEAADAKVAEAEEAASAARADAEAAANAAQTVINQAGEHEAARTIEAANDVAKHKDDLEWVGHSVRETGSRVETLEATVQSQAQQLTELRTLLTTSQPPPASEPLTPTPSESLPPANPDTIQQPSADPAPPAETARKRTRRFL